MGWKHSCKNLPAAYLTGYAAGLAAKKAEVKEAVLDHGLYDTTKGSKMYSALKGFVDAGLDIAHGKNIFPTDERLSGKHINKNVEKDFSAVKSKMK